MLGVFRELWRHRDLALVLGWRELVVRYKRSVVGVFWALAEPLVLVAVYGVVFGAFLDAGAGLGQYALFALMGVLAWTFLSSGIEQSTLTLLAHAPLVKKSYFPREILIFAVLFSRLTTLVVGCLLGLAGAIVASARGGDIAWERVAFLPLGLAAIGLLALGAGLLLSTLHVILRDVEFLVRFGLRLLFYACPIVYPVLRVPEHLRPLYDLNPLVGLLWLFQGFTNPALPMPSTVAVCSSTFAVIGVPLLGWASFRRLQWRVADLL